VRRRLPLPKFTDVVERTENDQEREKRSLYNQLAEVNDELVLYEPAGPYHYLQDRYNALLERSLASLENCPLEEIPQHRAVIRTIRHLVEVPDELRDRQARLQEQLNEYDYTV
jgi:hypothetical protein